MKKGFLLIIAMVLIAGGCKENSTRDLPNILICIADDAGHMGEGYDWLHTPAFDRVAKQGILFSNAYTPNAKCAPSRASLLTARNSWQLKEAANHFNNFPEEFKTFPEALKDFGYYTGYTGKGWGPGNPGTKDGRERELCGKAWDAKKTEGPTSKIADNDYSANFFDFYEKRPKDKPFYFWYGGYEPHRRYEYGSSIKAGKKVSDIENVPEFFPDNETVRTDMLDYALEIEYFDSHVGRMLDFLEERGELENTLIIVTSDHGMPFPRAKSDEYHFSNHIPLALMWGNKVKDPGRIVEAYISLIDVAPSLLEVAGIDWKDSGMKETPGSSLIPFIDGISMGFRDYVLIGKERHDVGRPKDYGYPIRGIVKDKWMYLRNYRPDLWPAGNPECGYSTVDGSPTKTEVLKTRHDPATRFYWEWSFGKRPAEELFYLADDPYCINNLASDDRYDNKKNELKVFMEEELRKQADPRMFGQAEVFHTYEYTWEIYRDLYDKMVVNKEDVVPMWINESDIETDLME